MFVMHGQLVLVFLISALSPFAALVISAFFEIKFLSASWVQAGII